MRVRDPPSTANRATRLMAREFSVLAGKGPIKFKNWGSRQGVLVREDPPVSPTSAGLLAVVTEHHWLNHQAVTNIRL